MIKLLRERITKSRGAAVLTVVVLVVIVFLISMWRGGEPAGSDVPVYTVSRGPLTISVTEAGTISALDQIEIKSEVEGQSTILFLAEEGKMVEEGELLVELDASQLNDRLVEQQIRVYNTESAFIRARENFEVTHNQATADVARAQLDLQFAREDLVRYTEGDYPKQVMELDSRITLAREELEQATQTLEWSRKLFEERYISQTEFDRDQLAQQRARLDFELAQVNMDLLKNHNHQRRLDELRSNLEQTEMALERVRRRTLADVVQAEADLKAREAEYNRQKVRLERIEEQIAKTRIYAPRSGMVVYASTGQSRWSTGEPLQEGQQVRERQTLIYLPMPGSMMAEVKVHESALEKVAVGQIARISLDALPGRAYTGSIVRIAPLPDGSTRWMNPDLKLYDTRINIDGQAVELRTGMSCRAEILVEQYEDVVAIPLQAVLRVNGQPTVYVKTRRGFEPRVVRIGLDNNRMVHVLEGLNVDDVVSLAPPLEEGAVRTLHEQAPEVSVMSEEPAM